MRLQSIPRIYGQTSVSTKTVNNLSQYYFNLDDQASVSYFLLHIERFSRMHQICICSKPVSHDLPPTQIFCLLRSQLAQNFIAIYEIFNEAVGYNSLIFCLRLDSFLSWTQYCRLTTDFTEHEKFI